MREVSLVAEALHEAGIARIASRHRRRPAARIRVVLIAGPSSSGKTTFSKRLPMQLLANGLRPMPLGLDDYFVDRDETPRDENGEFDYETIRALDLELFNEQPARRSSPGGRRRCRRYNFLTGSAARRARR